MKYVLMFCDTPDLYDQVDEETAKATYEEIFAWFSEQGAAGRIANGGAELQPYTTATTVKGAPDGPVVVDGPFSEAKEVVGGFTDRRRARPRRRARHGPHLARPEAPGRERRGAADRRARDVTTPDGPDADAALSAAIRAEAGTIVASLYRLVGDFDVAEEAVQDAVVEALRAWRPAACPSGRAPGSRSRRGATPSTGCGATSGCDAVLDRMREDVPPASEPTDVDERLPLIFGCCHPALAVEARLALTLRAVVGLTTAQIARAFLVSEATVAQRIVRAKRKIVSAGIPLTMPAPEERAARLDDVLTVAYLMFNEGFVSTRRRRRGTTGTSPTTPCGWPGCWPRRCPGRPRQSVCWPCSPSSTPGSPPGSTRRAAWCCCATRTAAAGTGPPSTSGEALLERAAALRSPGTVPAPGGDRGLPRLRADLGGDRLAPDPRALRHAAAPRPVPGDPAQPGRGAGPGPGSGGRARRTSTSSPRDLDGYHLFHATRADLLRTLGRPRRPPPPTDARSTSPGTRRSRRCCAAGWPDSALGAVREAGTVTDVRRPEAEPAYEPDPRRWRILAVTLVIGFMALLDVTIVNVALPSIRVGLGASAGEVQWIVSGYALTFGLTLVAGGRLGDAYGRRRMMLVGLGGFIVSQRRRRPRPQRVAGWSPPGWPRAWPPGCSPRRTAGSSSSCSAARSGAGRSATSGSPSRSRPRSGRSSAG